MSFSVFTTFIPVAGAVDLNSEVCTTSDPANRPSICNDLDTLSPEAKNVNPLYGPEGIITRAVNGLSLLAGLISVIMIIIAGIKVSMSTGDAGKIKAARDQIIYAIVGLIVAGLAQAIVRLLLNRIG